MFGYYIVKEFYMPGPLHEAVITPPLSRSRGCLLGGAVGDALGAPVEFMSTQSIHDRFGAQGITDYAPCYGRNGGAITDDTQMTMFTAEGLLRGYVRGLSRGMSSITSVVSHAYLRWLLTQGRQPRAKNVATDGWLYALPQLHSQRGPGTTCITELMGMEGCTAERARNDRKGCGGVMRIAPVGIFGHPRMDTPNGESRVFKLGCDLAGLTHGHPTGYLTGGVFALMIGHLMRGTTLRESVDRALAYVKQQDGIAETVDSITLALKLVEEAPNQLDAIEEIGEGWIAEEALAIGIYAALSATDFSSGIQLAVNHGGDSDSTGSIAGSLLGAFLGVEVIEPRWLDNLELRDAIDRLACDLVDCVGWNEDDDEIFDRYPGY